MLTTCPECETTFKIDQPQLAVRRGLVRCGRCNAVFNAYDTLQQDDDTSVSSEAGAAAWRRDGLSYAEPGMTSGPGDEYAPPAPATADERGGAADGVADSQQAAYAAEADREAVESQPDWLATLGDDSVDLATGAAPDKARPDQSPRPQTATDDILLSELPVRRGSESAGTGWKTFLYGMASVLLIMLLTLQAAYFLRGEIVSRMPELRPAFAVMCRELGCQLPLSRNPEAIRIEASSLETDPEQAAHASLRVTFSNRARVRQAWPHFMLKVSDVRNVTLAKRVFKPVDYLSKERAAERGMGPMSEMEFQLDLDLSGLSAAGYEVKHFYP